MGFLDKAKKLAEQAKDKAEQAKEKAEEALAEAKARKGESDGTGGAPASSTEPRSVDPRMGTPYVPGMLGRPGWREQGLVDPAAVLPVTERDRVGIPHSTKSQIVEEPFGVGRRWSSSGKAAGLFYQLDSEHRTWEPPGGKAPSVDAPGASAASLPDGRSLVFIDQGQAPVVLELTGLEPSAGAALASSVAQQLASS